MNKEIKEKDNKKTYIRIGLFILIIIWVLVVYELSGQTGTDSSGLSRKIASILFKKESTIDFVEPIIRKLAHFSEYTVGGILFYSLFSTYDYTKKQKTFISFFLGVWYAAFDEIHQLFIPGRNGNIIDVGIDSSGVLFGIIIAIIFFTILENNKNKKNYKKGKRKGDE